MWPRNQAQRGRLAALLRNLFVEPSKVVDVHRGHERIFFSDDQRLDHLALRAATVSSQRGQRCACLPVYIQTERPAVLMLFLPLLNPPLRCNDTVTRYSVTVKSLRLWPCF